MGSLICASALGPPHLTAAHARTIGHRPEKRRRHCAAVFRNYLHIEDDFVDKGIQLSLITIMSLGYFAGDNNLIDMIQGGAGIACW